MDFLFACLLFFVYFSVGCYFFANPVTVKTTAVNDHYLEVKQMFNNFDEVSTKSRPEVASARTDAIISKPAPQPKPQLTPLTKSPTVVQSFPLPKLTTTIDISSIKLIQARKLAKALGIKQKINGKNQTLSRLRLEIKAAMAHVEPEKLKTLEQILTA